MKWIGFLVGAAILTAATPLVAQSNDDAYTPLNSRIKRDRAFPTELWPRFSTEQMSKVNRDRSKNMLGQFSKCLFRRSNEKSLALLAKTDFGFADFAQAGIAGDKADKIYGFSDCLGRVAYTQQSGVMLRFSPGALRQWLLQEAYFDRYPDGPSWVKPGAEIAERAYPLSESNGSVRAAMDFADCVVQADPYSADYFFRSSAGSPGEKEALGALTPALGPCLPQGQQVSLALDQLRIWLGEGLWHVAQSIDPPRKFGDDE